MRYWASRKPHWLPGGPTVNPVPPAATQRSPAEGPGLFDAIEAVLTRSSSRPNGGDAGCGAGRRPDAWRGAARDHGDGAANNGQAGSVRAQAFAEPHISRLRGEPPGSNTAAGRCRWGPHSRPEPFYEVALSATAVAWASAASLLRSSSIRCHSTPREPSAQTACKARGGSTESKTPEGMVVVHRVGKNHSMSNNGVRASDQNHAIETMRSKQCDRSNAGRGRER
jgi:hypothetical protein